MDPADFLKLAEELVERNTPCDCRSAIGRAYYGVYNTAIRYMQSAGLTIPKGTESHKKIWEDFINCGFPELARAGSQLGDLHGMRRLADYEMDDPDPEDYKTARFCVNEAKRHIETVKRLLTGPDRSGIVSAIQGYRRLVGRRA